MGIFSRKPPKRVELPVIDGTGLSAALVSAAHDVGDVIGRIRDNGPLMVYLQKVLLPKLAGPAMSQDIAGCQSIVKSDIVVGPYLTPAFDAFMKGYRHE